MTFEELQERWKQQDAKLETLVHLTAAQLRTSHLDSMSTALDRVRRTIVTELAINAIALVVIGSFLWSHLRDPRYLIPAAILHACTIAAFAAGVRQLLAARRADYAMPVIEAQRRVTLLRMSRIRTSKWTLLIAPALWTPLVIVSVKGLLGIDFYAVFDIRWIVANIVWSIAFIPLMLWTARRFGRRFAQSAFVGRLADDLAGRSMNEAAAFARQLVEFERQSA
ncbi:MAG TPA: hypothetical protein VF911_04175 [Thermoanaerobaculia bacterium]|jgi:hypothetical protein